MLTDIDAAKYFIFKDKDRQLFHRSKLIERENHKFYEGNARLNKLLHLAQNIHIAKFGSPLLDANLYAYDNGVVSKRVIEDYSRLVTAREPSVISRADADFLDKIYEIFAEAPIQDLIELSHEDSEWQERIKGRTLAEQKINSMSRVDEYREQYADIVEYMDRMTV